MSTFFARMFVLSWLLLTGVAAAQKIGVIDMKSIADRSQRIQADLKKSQGQVQAQQDRLEAKMNEIQRVRQELNARRSAMSQTEVATQEEKLQTMRDEYNDLQTAMNKQIGQIQRQVLRPQAERIQKIIADVARQQGIDLVLDAEAVIYHSEAVDITPLVIQIFDRQSTDNAASGQGPAPALPDTKNNTSPKQEGTTPAQRGKSQDSNNPPQDSRSRRKP